jgi:phosphatidylglycerol---prolipoprotein diacylglyceryl transferase
MHPILFHVGPFVAGTHDSFVLLGVITAALVFRAEAMRRGALSEQMVWIVAGALITGAIAARVSTAWLYAANAPDPSAWGFIVHGGRSILGGLVGAYAGVLLTKRLVRYRGHTGDLFAPAVAAGMAVGRWGCFFAEQLGTPTTLPWGIRLAPAQAARIPLCPVWCYTTAMHPSFVYEIIFHAAGFVVLWRWLRWTPALRDQLFKLYLLAYALFRFGVEFVRGNQMVWEGLSRSQIFLIPGVLLLVAGLARRRHEMLGALRTSVGGPREERA